MLCSVTSAIRPSFTFTKTPGPAIKMPSVSGKAKTYANAGVNTQGTHYHTSVNELTRARISESSTVDVCSLYTVS